MGENVDYYISAVRLKGGHITHLRVHKAMSNGSYAPYGLVQPRSTVIMNLRSNAHAYKTLMLDGPRGCPGSPVKLVEVNKKYYLRAAGDDAETVPPGDDLGTLPIF
jgi:hypothetical protein